LTLLGLGLAAYGGARLFNRQLRGFAWLAAGLALSALIRPHVALLAILTLAVAYPLGRAKRVTPVTPLVTLAGAAVFVVGGVVLAGLTVHHFHLHGLSLHSLHRILKSNALNTGAAAQGQVGQFNSSISASTSLSPAAFPRDFYDVVLRPLPFNAHGLTQLVSSLENVFLLGLLLTSLPRLWAALMSAPKRAYILSALLFSVVWIILFASIGNLGILARERTQVLPWLLVLVCVPRRRASLVEAERPVAEPAVTAAAA
ncbi:MAG: hypothetical protein ACRD0J_06470, partial [Acidimicrobiales bacterium]